MQNQLFYRGLEINLDGPICALPYDIIWPLCARLSIESHVDLDGCGGDWKDLAGHVGLPMIAIDLIHGCKDRTKPLTFFKLWDQGIRKNRGTVRKLIIALDEAGFGKSYLKVLEPLLLGSGTTDSIQSIVAHLRSELDQPIFPPLELNDIVWDEELEKHTIHVSRSHSPDTTEEFPAMPKVHEEYIYISYHTRSKSKTYTREVRNLICLIESYGYKVFCEDKNQKYVDLNAQKERWIKSAANIIVVFNKEYQRAQESYIHNEKLPTCLEIDVPLISHIFHNVPGGRSRIIPVVIDQCRTQPPYASFPVWLTGTPMRLFPSQSRDLLACIQKCPARIIRPSSKVRVFKPQIVDGDSIRRKFFDSKTRV